MVQGTGVGVDTGEEMTISICFLENKFVNEEMVEEILLASTGAENKDMAKITINIASSNFNFAVLMNLKILLDLSSQALNSVGIVDTFRISAS